MVYGNFIQKYFVKMRKNGGLMKKTLLLLTLTLLATQLFAVSNLKVNGAASTTVTSLPGSVIVTCDVAATGNDVEFSIYFDSNNSKTLDADDILVDFAVVTDGIGWIRDPGNPDEDIYGDETAADKKLKTTLDFKPEAGTFFVGNTIIQAKDKDGSQATALITFNIQPVPPLIKGKVTAKSGGAALPNIIVTASKQGAQDEVFIAITDNNGNYQLGVSAGNWTMEAADYSNQEYVPSDSVVVPVAAGQTVTKDFQLEKYVSFIEGTIKKQDGTPVPDLMVYITGINPTDNGGMAYTDNTGHYKKGVKPGQLSVFTAQLFQPENWPDGFYADPSADTVNVASGQTVQVNFTLKPYTSFIEGTCKVNGTGLGGVQISAIEMEGFNFKLFNTVSKEDGSYKLGLSPGTVFGLNASKDGYDVTNPVGGYFNITVTAGQTVTGKDFTLEATSGEIYIAGTVTFENSSPAANVYVVAINSELQDRSGYQIQYTNGSGNYKFSNIEAGQWKVGVYKAGQVSTPYMQSAFVMAGMPADGVDFVLSQGTGVADNSDALPPIQFYLEQNYPNPFRPGAVPNSTSIRFYIDKTVPAEISIYNIAGQLVKQINQGSVQSGLHQFEWDGRDELGNLVPSGIYIYHLQAGDKSLTKRMVIVR
jgi:hypothetical protein